MWKSFDAVPLKALSGRDLSLPEDLYWYLAAFPIGGIWLRNWVMWRCLIHPCDCAYTGCHNVFLLLQPTYHNHWDVRVSVRVECKSQILWYLLCTFALRKLFLCEAKMWFLCFMRYIRSFMNWRSELGAINLFWSFVCLQNASSCWNWGKVESYTVKFEVFCGRVGEWCCPTNTYEVTMDEKLLEISTYHLMLSIQCLDSLCSDPLFSLFWFPVVSNDAIKHFIYSLNALRINCFWESKIGYLQWLTSCEGCWSIKWLLYLYIWFK